MELPKGIRLDRGYVQIRIMNQGQLYIRNFGLDSPEARQLAEIHLAEKRKEILMGKFNIPIKLARPKFADVARICLSRWEAAKDASGAPLYALRSFQSMRSVVNNALIPYFGRMVYAEIQPKHVMAWRIHQIRQVDGTTVNRQQNVLSSLFARTEEWVKTEQIKAFAIPLENPCTHVDKAPTKKRDRLLSAYELSKLKYAARVVGDENTWDNIALAVKTCLSLNDLMKLKLGDVVNLQRSKTGVAVALPITVLHSPDWKNWRKRWDVIRTQAGLADIEFRDLRKAGGNLLVGKHNIKLISLYMGHADQKTTEEFYTKARTDTLAPLAEELSRIVDSL
jgi:integrase